MSRFTERFLPRSERHPALWMAFGGVGLLWAVDWLSREVADQMGALVPPAPGAGIVAVQALAAASLALIAVAVAVRWGRAPQALGLYLALAGALEGVFAALDIPFALMQVGTVPADIRAEMVADVVSRGVGASAASVALALGAIAGTWLAGFLTLNRIRGVDANGEPLPEDRVAPVQRERWSFLGWQGRPVTGPALVAVAFVAVMLLPRVGALLLSAVYIALERAGDGMGVREVNSFVNATNAIGLAFVAVSAYLVTRKSGIRSMWLQVLVGVLVPLTTIAVTIAQTATTRDWANLGQVTWALLVLASPVASLGGTALALRGQPATLSAPVSQDPDAEEGADDTAGGSDG